MSKRSYISRYLLLIKYLKQQPYASFGQIRDYITQQTEQLLWQDDRLIMGFSDRTLQRDMREIRLLFGIDIAYSRAEKGYYIDNSTAEPLYFQRMLEAFEVFQLMQWGQHMAPYVHPEHRKPLGTEHLQSLMRAIQNRQEIRFSYFKFDEETPDVRRLQPLALKESKHRWYLMGTDLKDQRIKTFALDRMSQLQLTPQTFTYPTPFSVADYYAHCFGVLSAHGAPPQTLELSFDPFQGQYIKTLPLHHSQRILKDQADELRIELHLCITHDLIMELLSYGDSLRVLRPASLAQTLQQAHQAAYLRYTQPPEGTT